MLEQLAPIPLWFLLGWLLRRTRIAQPDHGGFLLRLLFLVLLPALVVRAVAGAPLTADKAWLPLLDIGVSAACMAAAWVWARAKDMDRLTTGSVILGAIVLNNALMFPFTLAGWGQTGFVDHALIDLGNVAVVSLVAYPLAFRYAGKDTDLMAGVRRALSTPILWALVVGLLVNWTGSELPELALAVIGPLAAMVSPVVLIALGILFSPTRADAGTVAGIVAIRMVVGLVAGIGLVAVLGLDGDTADIALLSAAAPIGFVTLSISSLAGLRTQIVSSAVSASLVIGLLLGPIAVTALTG